MLEVEGYSCLEGSWKPLCSHKVASCCFCVLTSWECLRSGFGECDGHPELSPMSSNQIPCRHNNAMLPLRVEASIKPAASVSVDMPFRLWNDGRSERLCPKEGLGFKLVRFVF